MVLNRSVLSWLEEGDMKGNLIFREYKYFSNRFKASPSVFKLRKRKRRIF